MLAPIKRISDTYKNRDLWRVNLVFLEDGTAAIWKNTENKVKEALMCFRREVLAYRIDKIFGFGMVPETVITEYKGRIGSLQRHVEGCRIEKHKGKLPIANLQKFALLDMVLNTFDRWEGNYFITENGNIVAHDNGDILVPHPILNLTVYFLMEGILEETKAFAREIWEKRESYYKFVLKEYLETYIGCLTTRQQILNALYVTFEVIKRVGYGQ